jgi:putative addiction module antidote
MVRKVFKSGNSMVVSIPKELLDTLHLDEGDEVAVELDASQRQIVITPVQLQPDGVDVEFAQQLADFIEQYRPALQALAK